MKKRKHQWKISCSKYLVQKLVQISRLSVIAEISANHNGSIELAKSTILAAKKAERCIKMKVIQLIQ